MCIDPLQRQTETAPTLSHSVSVCFPTWTVTLLRLFRWKSSFFWMSFSLFFITYKVVAMLYLWSSWHFVTVPLTKTFYRRETDVEADGMTCLKLFGKSVVEQIFYQIPTPCLTTKSVSLLPFLPCFIFPFHFSLLLSGSLMSSSVPSSPCQLMHVAWVPCCKPLPSDFSWFSVCSIHCSPGSHGCRSLQQQHRGG